MWVHVHMESMLAEGGTEVHRPLVVADRDLAVEAALDTEVHMAAALGEAFPCLEAGALGLMSDHIDLADTHARAKCFRYNVVDVHSNAGRSLRDNQGHIRCMLT